MAYELKRMTDSRVYCSICFLEVRADVPQSTPFADILKLNMRDGAKSTGQTKLTGKEIGETTKVGNFS